MARGRSPKRSCRPLSHALRSAAQCRAVAGIGVPDGRDAQARARGARASRFRGWLVCNLRALTFGRLHRCSGFSTPRRNSWNGLVAGCAHGKGRPAGAGGSCSLRSRWRFIIASDTWRRVGADRRHSAADRGRAFEHGGREALRSRDAGHPPQHRLREGSRLSRGVLRAADRRHGVAPWRSPSDLDFCVSGAVISLRHSPLPCCVNAGLLALCRNHSCNGVADRTGPMRALGNIDHNRCRQRTRA